MEYKVNQRSDEWHKLRKNVCLTASQFGDAVGVGLGKPFDFFKSLVSKDKDADDGQNDSEHIGDQSHWMEQGRRMEVVIREAYELLTGNKVVDSGFWVPQEDDPMHGLIGASPDGLVVDGSNGSRILGLVEFKAPAHNLFNKSEKAPGGSGIPRRYMVQMQGQMAVCGAAWCDFMAVCTKTRQVMLKRVFFQSRYWSHVSSALKQFCFAMQEAEIMQELGRDITGGPFAVQIHRQRMHDSPFPAEDIITVQNLLTCISSTLFRGPSRKLLSFDVLVGSHYVLPGSLNKYAQDLLTKVDAELAQKLSVKLSATNDGGDGDIQRIVFCGDASVAEEIAFPDSPDRIFEDAVCLFQSQDDLEVVVENCNKGKPRGPEDKVHLKETGSEEQTSAQTQDEENSLQGDKSESSPQRVSSVETSFQPAADQNADRVQASFSNSSGAKVLATSFAPAEAPTVRKIRRPGQMEAHKPASARSLPATSSATDTQPTASVPPTLQATETGSQEKGRLSQVPGSLSQVTRILSEIVETPSQVTSSQILGTSTQSTGMPSQVPRKSSQLTETSSQAKEALSSNNLPTFADQTGMATTAAAGTTATVGTAAAVGTKRSAKDEWDAAAAGRSLLKTVAENFALTKAAVVSAASGCTQSSVPLASDSALIQSGNVAPPILREESAMAVSDFVVLPDFPAPVIAITFQTATELSALKDPGQMMSDKMATSTTSDSLSEAKEVSAVGERQIEKEGGSQAQATNVSSLDADNINPGLTLVSKSDPETTTTVHSPGDKDMRQTKSDLPLKEDTSASEVGNVSECSKTWSVQVLTVDSVVEKSLKRPFTQRANTPEGEAKKLKEERVPIFTSHLPRESLDDAVPAFGQRRTSSEERGPAKDQMHRPWLNRLEGRSLQQVPFRDTDISFGRPSESERAAGTFRGPDDAHIPSLLNIRVDGGGNQRSLQYDRDSERSRATIDRCYHPGKTFDHQHIVVEEDFIRRMNPNFDHRMPGFLRDFEGHRRSHMDHLGQPSHRDLRNLNFLGVEVAGGMRQEMGQTSERRREGGGSSRLDGQSEFLPREVEPNRSGWVRPSGQWQQSLRLTLRHQQPIDFGGLRPTWVGSQQPPDNFLGVRRPLLSQRDFPESRERLAQRGNEGDYRPDSTRNNGFRGFPPGRRPDF